MARKDFYHEHVRKALIADGWTITHDPLYTPFDGTTLKIDLGAERLLGTKDDKTITVETIAVDVKDFLDPDEKMNELNRLIGQHVNYLSSLAVYHSNRKLYIAVTQEAYQRVFCMPLMALNVVKLGMRFIIFDPHACEIISWK